MTIHDQTALGLRQTFIFHRNLYALQFYPISMQVRKHLSAVTVEVKARLLTPLTCLACRCGPPRRNPSEPGSFVEGRGN